jgi:hypothetical protein
MQDRFKKSEALAHWRRLPEDAPLQPDVSPYKTKGSTYGLDGIRIEGSPAFIDAVLGRLKDLLAYESPTTRIGLAYQKVQPRPGKPSNGADCVCYVKFHERGSEAQIMNTRYGMAAE